MQDARSVLAGVLRALRGPFHVFREHVQHLHEDILHYLDGDHHLPDAIQAALLHNLRRPRRLVPPLENPHPRGTPADMRAQHRLHGVAVLVELLAVARVGRFRAPDCDAAQNEGGGEPDFALRRVPRTLQILLHS